MSVEKLQRVMWRLRSRNNSDLKIPVTELQRCVMLEIGTDPRTYVITKNALIRLQWIRTRKNRHIWLTGKDVCE